MYAKREIFRIISIKQDTSGMHMLCYERPGVVTALNGSVGYDKWDRDRGGGGGAGGATGGSWAGRDRERDRERERQARANQMSQAHAAEPDASSLFSAPIRVTGNRDRVSQQIQTKLGDYHLAQCFIDDPSKSIGICAEPPSPAPCPPSRRESEFKKPAHTMVAPQNGRVHHRPHPYNKNDGSNPTAQAHRPPPLRIPNGLQPNIDSSQPPIESILKEMKSIPTPLSVIAATPRKEAENKFIFNPHTNKVQENPVQEIKTPLTKPGLDNRLPNSRSSVSPDVVNKDLGLSESDDEVAAATHTLGPPISPMGSNSPTSGSSSPSDSESESSSTESSVLAAATTPATSELPAAPAQSDSWSLVNFAPPPAQPPDNNYETGKELRHALADVKGKSPISEMSDSETSSPSPGAGRRARSHTNNRMSAASSDDDTPHHSSTSPRVTASGPQKRGRPPKTRGSDERPAKKRRGRPPKARAPSPAAGASPAAAPSPPPAAPPAPDSDVEPDLPHHHHAQTDTKTHIFRRVFTPRKVEEGGGKGGKGGKGKGSKAKPQVTIIEATAPECCADDEERRRRERSCERRHDEALARVSPPRVVEPPARVRDERSPYRADRHLLDRPLSERLADRLAAERAADRHRDRISRERTPVERAPPERRSHERLSDRTELDRTSAERINSERQATRDRSTEPSVQPRLSADKLPYDRLSVEKPTHDRPSTDRTHDRMPTDRTHDRTTTDRTHDRTPTERTSHERLEKPSRIPPSRIDRLTESKTSIERLTESKTAIEIKPEPERVTEREVKREVHREVQVERVERYVKAEADVGSGLKRPSEELCSNVAERRRSRYVVRIPLSRLRMEVVRALNRPQPPVKRLLTPHVEQGGEVANNHERSSTAPEQTPIYFSYFERLPADALSDEEKDHKYYLVEAKRLRSAAEAEQDPLSRVMLYLESVLCFVLTGRVLELESDTKGAFTIYRETIEYIKSIHSMPQRFRASPHDTFNKLDILSLRVQALLYLRMFKMYNREVKEYNKIVHEYQQKPALAESVSPLSPSPSPAGSVGSVGSASSGYCSLAHSVPAHAHQALLLLTKYYAFLYVAHDLWEQADGLCRLRANQDLFIAVDRKCGPLSLSSTFRHLVQYVRYAISLLKNAQRE